MELATLYQQLSDGLLDCGYSAEGRSYKPHITLARRAKALAETELPKPIEWQIDRFFLYVSTPVVAPPRYQVIAQWPLTTGS
jgi:2'-5' RNA ligase